MLKRAFSNSSPCSRINNSTNVLELDGMKVSVHTYDQIARQNQFYNLLMVALSDAVYTRFKQL